ncbi:pyridoxine 5'-phosphate synthase [Roseomonas sp. E05]|uniref:pyridoxine 5'-phosphate synthase n=1 Tax=Roseomonas sp. E05 TaxID=3046310 RepID=UPI0024BA6FCE|nr:pyridoxine 5'-phosphate synthase [Roseomonas sp. E05]MDJ0388021.1 pyridoxine 5'-phosphate synthase [Roseomonas sp. E05]
MIPLRLSVNVDHVATLRNARGGRFPCPVEAARACLAAGADGITVHLREDRRHIRDEDVRRLGAEAGLRLNFEMAATEEMVGIAEGLHPAACCIVPEKRAELTTEGGLDARGAGPFLGEAVRRLAAAGIEVSLFVEPDPAQIAAAAALGAQAVELHTGTYADARPEARGPLLARLRAAAVVAAQHGLTCHAGHGLDFESVRGVAAIPQVVEVSIGHFLIGAAVFQGLPAAVAEMRAAIAAGRADATS